MTKGSLLPANENGRCLFGRCVGRANNNANANGGLVYANSNNGSSNSNTNNGGRLAIYAKKYNRLYGTPSRADG